VDGFQSSESCGFVGAVGNSGDGLKLANSGYHLGEKEHWLCVKSNNRGCDLVLTYAGPSGSSGCGVGKVVASGGRTRARKSPGKVRFEQAQRDPSGWGGEGGKKSRWE